MAYLVVAYPKISKNDFEWIQNYRRENDPRYFSIVEPHFTLVFAIDNVGMQDFIDEVKKVTQGVNKINFEIKVATTNLDDSGDCYHEFLVPDQGYSDIVKLHDKLYSGLFSPNLRFDIDFIPHIGIGNSEDVQTSKKRVDELNNSNISISGIIDSLDIVEYKDQTIHTLEKISLN